MQQVPAQGVRPMGAWPGQPNARLSSGYGGQQFPYMGQQQPIMQPQQPQMPQQQMAAQQPQHLQPQQMQVQPQQMQAQQPQQAKPQATPNTAPPAGPIPSPKMQANILGNPDPNVAARAGMMPPTNMPVKQAAPVTPTQGAFQLQQQQLEQRVRELEQIVEEKDKFIEELQAALAKAGVKPGSATLADRQQKAKSPTKMGSGFQKLTGSKPNVRYAVSDQNDAVDVRLEEFYNSTGSAVQFRRINHGFYRFGETIVELNIINHKLMARTEDGWNRNKFGPIEKFLMYYENIEREKAGIMPEA